MLLTSRLSTMKQDHYAAFAFLWTILCFYTDIASSCSCPGRLMQDVFCESDYALHVYVTSEEEVIMDDGLQIRPAEPEEIQHNLLYQDQLMIRYEISIQDMFKGESDHMDHYLYTSFFDNLCGAYLGRGQYLVMGQYGTVGGREVLIIQQCNLVMWDYVENYVRNVLRVMNANLYRKICSCRINYCFYGECFSNDNSCQMEITSIYWACYQQTLCLDKNGKGVCAWKQNGRFKKCKRAIDNR